MLSQTLRGSRSLRRLGWSALPLVALIAGSCGGSENANLASTAAGQGGATSSSSASTGGGGGSGAGGDESVSVALPASGSDVIDSAALRFEASNEVFRVVATEPVTGASCEAPAPYFECLLDLSGAEPGAIELEVVAFDAADEELFALGHSLTRRAVEVACPGTEVDYDVCVLDRAAVQEAAGFEGVTYINADDGHATAGTGTMTGIDAQSLVNPPTTAPAGVRMGVVNESRAWTPAGGTCSMPRCYAFDRRQSALTLYDQNMFTFWPEHRDHGLRDFYQWQAPFFALSQGSSGSELDEVRKLLRAMAMMTPGARDAAEEAKVLGPVMSFLLLRSRVESDLEYMTTEAFPTALANTESQARLLDFAAALRAGELVPIAKVSDHVATFPPDWTMGQTLESPYAIGYAPSADDGPKPSEFTLDVDLSATFDPGDRTVLVFPTVLRGPDSVVVERLDDAGRSWRIRGAYPEDTQLMTGGIERTVARITVGFFPHNGLWMGPPVLVSVGGHPAEEVAPNDNNAD